MEKIDLAMLNSLPAPHETPVEIPPALVGHLLRFAMQERAETKYTVDADGDPEEFTVIHQRVTWLEAGEQRCAHFAYILHRDEIEHSDGIEWILDMCDDARVTLESKGPALHHLPVPGFSEAQNALLLSRVT